MLKKSALILSLNENKLSSIDINDINEKIISLENFDDSLILKQKDLNCFNIILKVTNSNTFSIIDFIIKNTNKKYKEKKFEGKEGTKYFIIKQIFLLFIYLSKQKEELIQNEINNLYQLLLKIHDTLDFINIKDLIEIIRFNILISMKDLINRHNIFLNSIKFLIEYYKSFINKTNEKNKGNKEEKEIILSLNNSLIKVFESIYKYLLNNKINLSILQKYDNIRDLTLFNICIFCKNENEPRLNDIIDKILLLIYSHNYRKLINDNILEDIKEGFYELKKGNNQIIKNIIHLLTNKSNLINHLYKNEKKLTGNDSYLPHNYFVFNQFKESGLNYNTEFDLFNYNFLLTFSFKCSSDNKNGNYPLLTFLSNNNENEEPNILLNISIQNKHLIILFQNEYQELTDYEINFDATVLVIIEFYKNKKSKDKLKFTLNNQELKKGMNFSPITYNGKVDINIGYLNDNIKSKYSQLKNISSNYEGIIGPVLFLIDTNKKLKDISTFKLLEENSVLIPNIIKLKGYYDNFIYMNDNYELKNSFIYEKDIMCNTNNIICNWNKDRKMEYFIISPLSMINSICNDTNVFINYFNILKINHNSKKESFLKTLAIPSKYNNTTYAKMSFNTIQSFVQNDGINLLNLLLDYYYNILNMIIEYIDFSDYENKLSVSSEINKAIIPIFEIITKIMITINIKKFKIELESFGFCLMKTLNLLGDVSNLKNELIQCFIDNTNELIKYNRQKNDYIIHDFLNKLFVLICNPKYFDVKNSKHMSNIFKIFHEILLNNNDLMSIETFNLIIRFSFIFSHEYKEKEDAEFKIMIKEYKSLIELLLNQYQSTSFYLEYLNIFINRHLSMNEKYKLIKIFYKTNKIKSLINFSDDNDENAKIIEEKNNKKDVTKWKLFNDKKKKNNEKNKKELNSNKSFNHKFYNELNDIYKKFLEKILLTKNKNKTKNNIKYYELLKCILIQLSFELNKLIGEIYPDKKNYFFSSHNEINKKDEKAVRKSFHVKTIIQKSSQIDVSKLFKKRPSFSLEDSDDVLSTKTEENKYLFDELLNNNNISFYVIKSLFTCLFSKWENNEKFKFIKDNECFKFDKFKCIFGDFDKYKKKLFIQILKLFNLISEENDKKKFLNLILHFLLQSIEEYKSLENPENKSNEETKFIAKIYFHLFESKSIMKEIFNYFLLNKEMINDDKCIQNIVYICNNAIEYHPKPFIFSFLKFLMKNENINNDFTEIYNGIAEKIIDNIKKDSELMINEKVEILKRNKKIFDSIVKSENYYKINSYLYFNEIRFIKCIIKIFKAYPKASCKIIEENDFYLLSCLQKLILAFLSSNLIYDINLYIFLPTSLEYIFRTDFKSLSSRIKKTKEKNEIKLLESSQAKLLSNQILFLDIFELSFHIIYILRTMSSNANAIIKITSFIKSISEKIYYKGHFITFYLDIFNSKNANTYLKKAKVDNSIASHYLEEIPLKYDNWKENNIEIKDNRLFSILLFLIIFKYENLLIYYQNHKEKNNDSNINDISGIFEYNLNLCITDIIEINKYYSKIKDKKAEIILDKEEMKDKEFHIQKNYYKHLMNFILKGKNINSSQFTSFKIELQKKYLKDEEESLNAFMNSIKNRITKDLISNMRKDSFNTYCVDEEDDDFIVLEFSDSNEIESKSTNGENNKKKDISFFNATEQILCTKRDLILKKFGYYFFKDYFKDERFIKTKNYFLKLHPPTDLSKNYNDFEKQMKLEYPSILKNFSNCINYYPKMFLRPDLNFFKNKYLYLSHQYLQVNKNDKIIKKENNNNKDYLIINDKKDRIMNFEYSHGLLNQDKNNFNLFSVGNTNEINFSSIKYTECEYINNKNTIQGRIKLIKNWIVFQTNSIFDISMYKTNFKYRIASRKEDIDQKKKQIIIPLNLIQQMIYRNFLFYTQALEVFLYNGKSYFFNFYEFKVLESFVRHLKEQYKLYEIKLPEIINDPMEYFINKNYTNDWVENRLSTIKYLLLINKFSGRTYNDVSQYLIFPWVLNNYTDIKNKDNYRKMQYSMATQDEEHLEAIKKEYNKEKDTEKSHFNYHYSNSSKICLYLLRLNPFTYNQIKLNGQFDSPDRQIENLQDMCYVLSEFKETSELVPEYFFMVECFLNLNFNYFGEKESKENKKLLNNLKLNIDFSSLLELILFHKNFLNSDEVGININKWIDNIFGENQITSKKNVINKYPVGCYSKYVKKEVDDIISDLNRYKQNSKDYSSKVAEALKEIKRKTDHAYLFGQCPPQLFQKAHPEKMIKDHDQDSNDSSEYDINKKCLSEIKIHLVQQMKILYLGFKNGNNNLFILTNDELLVVNKSLEFVSCLQIENLNYIFDPNDDNELKKLFNKFSYKNLIFEIDDCNIFFIGGYYDNSLKIYFTKNKIHTNLSFALESRITCLKHIPNTNTFLSGHLNGKIIKWKYDLLLNKYSNIDAKNSSVIFINKISSIIGHNSFVQNIEISDELNIIISASNDGFIFIRKLFDFELLNVIRYNCNKMSLIDLCLDNQIILATYYNKKEKTNIDKKIKVNTYSVNGIKLGKVNRNITIPFNLKDSNDKLFIFINKLLYEVYITFKEWELVVDLNKLVDKEDREANIISFEYDSNMKLIFCLFDNGKLIKINLQM